MSVDFCIILTCTIDVKGVAFMSRTDIHERYHDYKNAFSKWLLNGDVEKIVFVENSGYDLSTFKEMSLKFPEKNVEFISFDGQDFDRSLGKGYGEMLALKRCLYESEILKSTERFIKVNGRYYVPKIFKVTKMWKDCPDVICDLSRSLTWSDSRVFGGTRNFLQLFLLPELVKVNDSKGIYFEHALAKASHMAIINDLNWSLCPPVNIIGVSGTGNYSYSTSKIKEFIKLQLYKIKKIMIKR